MNGVRTPRIGMLESKILLLIQIFKRKNHSDSNCSGRSFFILYQQIFMANFESSVKVIPYSQERVYNKLSDLSNLEAIKDRLPQDKVEDLSFDSDTLSFTVSPVGQLTLQIVERDPCKSIKLATTNSPLPFNMWIQLVETAEEECNVKVTIEIDINPFMKAMVQKPLQEGLEKMVEMLAVINY